MKKYIKPEINIKLFEIMDVVSTSSIPNDSGRLLNTVVNGNEGTDYGSQEVSVFE